MPKGKGIRTQKLSAPAYDDEVTDYQAACKKADIEPADTLRKLCKALVDHVDKHGRFTFPVQFSDQKNTRD